jgi:hypothetical protein
MVIALLLMYKIFTIFTQFATGAVFTSVLMTVSSPTLSCP